MTNSTEKDTVLKISRSAAREQILRKIAKAKEIGDMNITDENQLAEGHRRLKKWKSITASFLESIFSGSKYVDEFQHFAGGVFSMSASFTKRLQQFESWLQDDIDCLDALIEKLPYISESIEESAKKSQTYIPTHEPVFVVHGHDESMNQQVMRFVEKLGLKPIDLREQPGGTLSMQEKLEKHLNAKFAIVLFTADDIGRLKTVQAENPRNRQNVIYELAGFQKQLGREHVVIIQKEKTELPSDIVGINYIDWSDSHDGWKILLARELKNAGLSFDLNVVL